MAAALATLSGSHARAHPSTSATAYDVSVRSVGQNGILKPVTVTDVKSWNGFPNSVPARSLTVPCIGHGARFQQRTTGLPDPSL
jgi:hypothetical protein